ncbi:hypothetical protein PHMEG_0009082 [Phytophthora megakarya]|uniref:SET domain-containing protein n=1 Tax=Phytophthora megakarya TaxID=4795 RepID=A0A225WH21_9STRA|nr:hypothetical protein PHMEG_0009082 [Phytophthora megakarya]
MRGGALMHGVFCTLTNYSFGGRCGNAVHENDTVMQGVVATAPIPAGEMIGEYLGRMELFRSPRRIQHCNEGTRMLKGQCVAINALNTGGPMCLLNHSCNPSARFREVQTGAGSRSSW